MEYDQEALAAAILYGIVIFLLVIGIARHIITLKDMRNKTRNKRNTHDRKH